MGRVREVGEGLGRNGGGTGCLGDDVISEVNDGHGVHSQAATAQLKRNVGRVGEASAETMHVSAAKTKLMQQLPFPTPSLT